MTLFSFGLLLYMWNGVKYIYSLRTNLWHVFIGLNKKQNIDYSIERLFSPLNFLFLLEYHALLMFSCAVKFWFWAHLMTYQHKHTTKIDEQSWRSWTQVWLCLSSPFLMGRRPPRKSLSGGSLWSTPSSRGILKHASESTASLDLAGNQGKHINIFSTCVWLTYQD